MYYLPQKKSFFSFLTRDRRATNVALTLEISDNHIHFCVLKKTGNKKEPVVVSAFGTKILPHGVIIAGVIRNEAALSEVIDQIQKETKQKRATLIISDVYVYTFPVQVHAHTEAQIHSVLKNKIEDLVPSHITKTVFYSTVVHKKTKYTDVVLRAIPVEVIKGYRTVFKKAKLSLESILCTSDAIVPLLSTKEDRGAKVSIHIGAQQTVCAIASCGVVHEVRSVLVGGEMLQSVLEKANGVIPSHARKSKKEKGYIRFEGSTEILYSVAALLNEIVKEVEQLVELWQKRSLYLGEAQAIDEIVVSGEDAAYTGVVEYIAQKLTYPVHKANIWRTVYDFDSTIPSIPFDESLLYAPVIGGGVRRLKEK